MNPYTSRVVVRVLVYITLILMIYGAWYVPHWPMRYAFGLMSATYGAAAFAVLCNWDKD